MPADRHAARRQKLIRAIRRESADALLVTNFTNVSYLTGFSGDDSHLLIGPSATVLISDSRYTTQLQQECPGLDLHIRGPGKSMTDAAAKVVARAKLATVGFESGSLTYDQWHALAAQTKSADLKPLSGLVEKLRLVKDSHEIAEIRKAVYQAEHGFQAFRACLLGDMTERRAAHELEHSMRRFGAVGASFAPIVAVGSQSALPHARPTDREIGESSFVLVDWGATAVQGYKSDLTRIIVTGKISPKLARIYRVVLNAQRIGIDSIRPGLRCCDVDQAARKSIANAGYGKNFGHGLGHGIGLDIHEGPRLGPSSTETLKPGMVVTVEPGVYLPGWGGIRIEDDVLVTRDGCEVLTSTPKELQEAVLE